MVSDTSDSNPLTVVSLKLTWYIPAGNASTSDCVTVFPSPVWSTCVPFLIAHSNFESTSFLSPVILLGLIGRSTRITACGNSTGAFTVNSF